jgi:hypothetical protein
MLGPNRDTFKVVAKCIFCGAKNLSKEHIFSRWTHKYLPPRSPGKATASIGIEYPHHANVVVVKLSGQLRDWQVKVVCGGTHLTCNGGWMKDIEDIAKPILVPLILGQPTRISPQDQRAIATWAVLKSMIADFDRDRSARTTHHMQLKRLWRKQLPPAQGWGVWIGHYERKNWKPEWLSRPFLLLPDRQYARRAGREASYFNSNGTTQIINKLFIQVIHSPHPRLIERWRFSTPEGGPLSGSLFRIWPPSEVSIGWGPPKALTDRDADVASNAVMVMAKLVAAVLAARR